MSVIIHQTFCPCCNSENINEAFVTNDFSVSKQIFAVWQCNDCCVRFTQNIPDANSIEPYYKSANYISHSDTKEGLINKIYHSVRNFTLQTKKKLIVEQTGFTNGSLLDIGAGTGAFANIMQQSGWQVKGLEPDTTASNIAFQKYGLRFQHPQALFDQEPLQFDAITLWHVLEHIHDVHGYLQCINKILKQNGKVFIAVPNYTSADAAIYKEYWAAYDVPRHLYHFSPLSFKKLAEQHNFLIAAYKPMWFDSFYVSMLSEKYKNNGRNNYIMAILNGCISNIKTLVNVEQCSSIIYVLSKAN
ncbi:MAG TPA: class I SAM-dependent methyltransferase [Chitinophagaceae bacterium]|nr:class I SAM-dependent methyltransferase [Chitinophagaceae bacterium]MCC6635839.1 class I SAM-dependent methyltransferase [Chitinophagaceae bacterium]HMZ46082.1 class I SAM-dependent methyltransferase [Chitinophagaceae bacterium]HNJ58633.1 class I SAM-dependent methyltransferase [Chitinophagaceae bacterium]HNM34813.1 class I SAM-dependent methyltransferase [Chitinophagaceae bacterium]